ncbi:unnamed protein product [Gongylonema pulchrum]|uniref:HOOK domain-containing protein n=1 Tax=Gongylonema pulchrum TaxID=637853 RepID=A0A183DEG2_9BILA|nr:unnamed protein product [Gongylonema pulchrum]
MLAEKERSGLLREIEHLKLANAELSSELDAFKQHGNDKRNGSPDVKRKVSELMAENARLAGELLREQSGLSERDSDQKQEVKKLLEEREAVWKSREQSLRQEQDQALMKQKQEFEHRLKQHDEKWMVKSREQFSDLEETVSRLTIENKKLTGENDKLGAVVKEMQGIRERDERFTRIFFFYFHRFSKRLEKARPL